MDFYICNYFDKILINEGLIRDAQNLMFYNSSLIIGDF